MRVTHVDMKLMHFPFHAVQNTSNKFKLLKECTDVCINITFTKQPALL